MYYYYLVVLLLFHIFMIIIRKTARERHVWIRGSGNYIFCGVLWKRHDIDLPLYLGWVTGYEGRGGFGGVKTPRPPSTVPLITATILGKYEYFDDNSMTEELLKSTA